MRLHPCPRCNHHARADEDVCPHCEAPLRSAPGRFTPTTAALLLGLLPIACASPERAPKKAEELKAPATAAEPKPGEAEPEPEPQPELEPEPQPEPNPPPDSIPEAAAYGAPPTDWNAPEPRPVPDRGAPVTETPE